LNAFNNGCASTRKTIIHNHLWHRGRFGYTVNCNNKLQVSFSDSSIGATTLTWNFGDGSPSVSGVPNPVHTFPAFGDYDVSLTTTQGACTYVKVKKVRVVNVKANYTFNPPSLCRGNRVTLSTSETITAFSPGSTGITEMGYG
jgi:PKD repeat protein